MENLNDLVSALGKPASDFWKEVTDTMLEAMVIVSTDRRILYMNRPAEELVGAELPACAGEECIKAINCPQCECTCRLFEHGEVNNLEVALINSRTRQTHIVVKNARLLRNAAGDVIGGVETFKDITTEVAEREEKQARIRQVFLEKKRTESLVDSLPQGVISLDRELRIKEFSHRMEEITGFVAAELRGAALAPALLAAGQSPLDGGFDAILDKRFRIDLRSKEGRLVPVEICFRPVRFHDEELLALVTDLSDPDSRALLAGFREQSFQGIISQSPAMQGVFRLLENVAGTDANVFIQGESGTGKELVARAVHRLSPRRNEPFCALNCATFSGSLLLSELFGHERGAFTGAERTQKGRLEMAGEGTLFLDEVSEIPAQHQAVLLRVLEERTFERLGGRQRIEMKARIISATNRQLAHRVEQGRFREDLFYRLKVVPIYVPPLREREGDVELLANYFLRQLEGGGQSHKRFSRELMNLFESFPWPGNVRELKNLVEYLHFVSPETIDIEHLPDDFLARVQGPSPTSARASVSQAPAQDEAAQIRRALEQCRYRRSEAARLLGVDRSTLWRKMKKYRLIT